MWFTTTSIFFQQKLSKFEQLHMEADTHLCTQSEVSASLTALTTDLDQIVTEASDSDQAEAVCSQIEGLRDQLQSARSLMERYQKEADSFSSGLSREDRETIRKHVQVGNPPSGESLFKWDSWIAQ